MVLRLGSRFGTPAGVGRVRRWGPPWQREWGADTPYAAGSILYTAEMARPPGTSGATLRVLKTSYRCPSSTQGACRPFMDATSRRWCHATGHFTSRGARWHPAPSLPRACWHALSGRPPRTRRRFRPHTSTAGPAHRVRPATRPSAAVVNFLPFSRGRGGAAARDRRFHQRGPLRDQGPGLRERDSALGCLIRPPGGAPRRLERARTHVFAVLGA